MTVGFLREAMLGAGFVSLIWSFMDMQRKGLCQKPTDFQKKVMATRMLHSSLLKPNIRQHFRSHKEILKAPLMGQGFMKTTPSECWSGLTEK